MPPDGLRITGNWNLSALYLVLRDNSQSTKKQSTKNKLGRACGLEGFCLKWPFFIAGAAIILSPACDAAQLPDGI